MQISKSNYLSYLKHPALLWLEKNDKAKLPPIDEATQAMFDAGHKFEPYAESLFDDGVTLGFNNYHQYRDLPKRSHQALTDGATVLFQSRFETANYNCLPDVIKVIERRNDDSYLIDLYEIKSSTSVKRDHLYDLAFQKAVLQENGLITRNVFVMHVNNQYVRQGEVEADKLVTTVDVTTEVAELADFTAENMPRALTTATAETMPDPSMNHLGVLGVKADWREILNFMYPTEAKYEGEVTINKPAIHDFLADLKYPLYFLDYETMQGLVPYFDGQRPYQQVPFQYSLHILDSPSTDLRHTEYLHTENSNPMRPLAEQLIRDLGDTGTVIVWNQGFEMSRNREISETYPELAQAMTAINGRVVDLMIPFKQKFYDDPRFGGSASIKSVLPVLVPSLSYKELCIQNGGSAQRAWIEAALDETKTSEKDQILADLQKYCHLDTLAMVEIWRVLMQISN